MEFSILLGTSYSKPSGNSDSEQLIKDYNFNRRASGLPRYLTFIPILPDERKKLII